MQLQSFIILIHKKIMRLKGLNSCFTHVAKIKYVATTDVLVESDFTIICTYTRVETRLGHPGHPGQMGHVLCRSTGSDPDYENIRV